MNQSTHLKRLAQYLGDKNGISLQAHQNIRLLWCWIYLHIELEEEQIAGNVLNSK